MISTKVTVDPLPGGPYTIERSWFDAIARVYYYDSLRLVLVLDGYSVWTLVSANFFKWAALAWGVASNICRSKWDIVYLVQKIDNPSSILLKASLLISFVIFQHLLGWSIALISFIVGRTINFNFVSFISLT